MKPIILAPLSCVVGTIEKVLISLRNRMRKPRLQANNMYTVEKGKFPPSMQTPTHSLSEPPNRNHQRQQVWLQKNNHWGTWHQNCLWLPFKPDLRWNLFCHTNCFVLGFWRFLSGTEEMWDNWRACKKHYNSLWLKKEDWAVSRGCKGIWEASFSTNDNTVGSCHTFKRPSLPTNAFEDGVFFLCQTGWNFLLGIPWCQTNFRNKRQKVKRH